MPSSTFLNLAPEKQEKLLSAAVREFTERPYNEASINRIVREAGIPRGSFYMYFRDKEDLFHYLMEESINEMLMVFEEVLRSQGGDIFAALPAMYDHLQSRRSADRSLGGMGMMSAIVNRNDGLQKGGLLEFLDPDHILKRMEGCVNPDLLDLREPEDLNCILRMLIVLIVPIMYNGIRPETDPEDREKLERALEILRRGMGAKTHPAQRSKRSCLYGRTDEENEGGSVCACVRNGAEKEIRPAQEQESKKMDENCHCRGGDRRCGGRLHGQGIQKGKRLSRRQLSGGSGHPAGSDAVRYWNGDPEARRFL